MAKYAAYGVDFKIGDSDNTGTAVYTTVAQLMSLNAIGLEAETVDVSTHDGDGWREFLTTLREMVEIECELVFDPTVATHANASGGLLYELMQNTKKAFQIVLSEPSAMTFTFVAYVNNFTINPPLDGALTATVSLRPTGQPTIS